MSNSDINLLKNYYLLKPKEIQIYKVFYKEAYKRRPTEIKIKDIIKKLENKFSYSQIRRIRDKFVKLKLLNYWTTTYKTSTGWQRSCYYRITL